MRRTAEYFQEHVLSISCPIPVDAIQMIIAHLCKGMHCFRCISRRFCACDSRTDIVAPSS